MCECVCVRERIEIFIYNNYLLLKMVDEKPLEERNDLYTRRRRLMQYIIDALNSGKSREHIYFNVTLKYGFGEKMVDRMIELAIIEQETRNKEASNE